MLMVPVQVPTDVLAEPPGPWLPETIWDTDDPIPDALALQWLADRPFEAWSAALLMGIDPATLPERERPVYIAACDRAEAVFAARRDRATLLMAGPSDNDKPFHEVDAAAHELVVALRIPLGAARSEVFRSRQLAKLPGTRALYEQGLITRRHVAKITTGTAGLTRQQCAQVEDHALKNAELASVHEFARRVRRAVAKVHPRTARQRHTQAAAQSDVTFQPADHAMGWLTSVMPLIDALTCKNAYDHYALAKKKAGDPRPLGVLRAEAQRVFAEHYLSGLLTGTVPTHHGCVGAATQRHSVATRGPLR